MFRFWKQELAAKEEDHMIRFAPDDDLMTRAANIWYGTGMANDRFGAIPKIAGFLAMYRDWDEKGKH